MKPLNPRAIGESVPSVPLIIRENEEWVNLDSMSLFKDKSVIVFALPGAFTPTCSSSHVPRYNELAPVLKATGVDDIICMSVNDCFVMDSWRKDQGADNIRFIADGNGEFAEQMGLLVDKTNLGFGKRSWRYSMLVKNGVIEQLFVEPWQEGDPFEVSDADTMLNAIAPSAQLPRRVTIFTKPGCPHCARAKDALADQGYNYEEIVLGQGGVSYSTLAAVTGKATAPQVFIEGRLIGGADDLEAYLQEAETEAMA